MKIREPYLLRKRYACRVPLLLHFAKKPKFKEQVACSLNDDCVQLFFSGLFSLEILSQDWLPTVQLVLQADWHVLLHSPHPVTLRSAGRAIVLILFITISSVLFIFILLFYYSIQTEKLQAFFYNSAPRKGFFPDHLLFSAQQYRQHCSDRTCDRTENQIQYISPAERNRPRYRRKQKISDQRRSQPRQDTAQKRLFARKTKYTAQSNAYQLNDLIYRHDHG